ncbi:hypothetical protein C0993_007030 [Termitomyces sp. T159_Od127]|nr:hypothetical protein C0993_007030 [Termitomyces sp. T159_Od127]
MTKHLSSSLKAAVPKTYEIEISFADELDEMWADDLWELGELLDTSPSWWILKPGMSDRGMGIRIFNSKESLQQIFEEFELSDDEGESSPGETAVVTSQLRHFVIQEYIPNPLLLDPSEASIDGVPKPSEVKVPYEEPTDASSLDLTPHLTNTSLQTHKGEEGVRLFDELVGCQILSSHEGDSSLKFTREDLTNIVRQMVEVLGETFKAALENPVHFQPLPNAFELYGIDFLVAMSTASGQPQFQVKLLEINAEPAIELTGPRLTWILEDLFVSIGKIEEGSYGVVFRARDKQTGDIVALKKLKLDEEKNGFPITALREIFSLMTCRHENVVSIREVVVGDTLTQ